MTKFNISLWNEALSIKENAEKIGIAYNYAAEMARAYGLSHKRSKVKFLVKVFPPILAKFSIGNLSRSLDKLKPDQQSWLLWEGCD